MTEPTQAQINAARNRLADWHALYGTIPDEAITAALKAAAGVEEPSVGLHIVNKTIDLCARVADKYKGLHGNQAEPIAAAIRALTPEKKD